MTTNSMNLTEKHAKKVLEIVDQGLIKGLGKPEPGKMCVEAAVCFALGLPHSDNPPCVSPVVRSFKIRLNDMNWPTNQDRTEGMRALAIAQLGSDGIDEQVFVKELAKLTIQKIVPIALRHAATTQKLEIHKQALLEAANQCEQFPTKENALLAKNAAYAAADAADATYAAAAYAAYAAYAAAYAAYAAADATYAAADATYAAADATYAAAAAYVRVAKNRLTIYKLMASIGVEALKVAGSIGCKWLDIVK